MIATKFRSFSGFGGKCSNGFASQKNGGRGSVSMSSYAANAAEHLSAKVYVKALMKSISVTAAVTPDGDIFLKLYQAGTPENDAEWDGFVEAILCGGGDAFHDLFGLKVPHIDYIKLMQERGEL